MSLYIHETLCNKCSYDAFLMVNTSNQEAWIECLHCGEGIIRDRDWEVIKERGYESMDEVVALLKHIQDYPIPYSGIQEAEEMINWVEFCRALKEQDFTPGDEFSLNGIHFEVKGV